MKHQHTYIYIYTLYIAYAICYIYILHIAYRLFSIMILTKQMRLDRVMLLQILRRKRTYIETIKYFFTEMYLQ